MDIDESNLPELRQRLDALPLPAEEVDVLVRHLRDRLIGHFGAEVFDVWQAKWGLHKHSAEEVAMVAITQLAPIWAEVPEGAISTMADDGTLATPVVFPWEDRY